MTKTKTKCIEDPTYAIFLKSRELKDTDAEITKTKCIEDPTWAIFSKSREFKGFKYDQTGPDRTGPDRRRIQSRGPNSRTCVLVE